VEQLDKRTSLSGPADKRTSESEPEPRKKEFAYKYHRREGVPREPGLREGGVLLSRV
jgi:hypothetical protein